MNYRYFYIYKPYNMLCQFSGEGETLKNLAYPFPKNVYPVGRLDKDSEGLLILTNDTRLNDWLLHPRQAHQRTYWAQVEGIPAMSQIAELSEGVPIQVDKKTYHTQPCKVKLLEAPPILPDRNPPIRYRANIPTSWLSLTLSEGKNRQVRKMTAAIACPTLRLVRHSIESLSVEGMQPGEIIEIKGNELFRLLNIKIK